MNGDVYEGEWEKGEINGYGKKTFANGDIYEGEWRNGEKHGKGKYTSIDGYKYEGDYVNGKRSGVGMLTNTKNGESKRGIWEYGNFVQWIENH